MFQFRFGLWRRRLGQGFASVLSDVDLAMLGGLSYGLFRTGSV